MDDGNQFSLVPVGDIFTCVQVNVAVLLIYSNKGVLSCCFGPPTVQAYDEAVSLGGEEEATARSNRAAAYLKVNKHREALQDASAAVRLQPTEVAFYRKG